MLICQRNADFQPSTDTLDDVNWTQAARAYPNIEEAPSFIAQQQQTGEEYTFSTSASPLNLQGKQLQVYSTVHEHSEASDLEGDRLQVQQSLSGVKYLINDEMSMVGRKMFGQVDRHLRQVFPRHAQEVLGGCSCLLFADFGQLPPVMDLPLYTTDSRNELSVVY